MDRSTNRPGRGGDDPNGIRRSLLRDAVFARLLDNVLRGVYRRGQRIRLDDIADDMGVSRTPVREALVPLETLRLGLRGDTLKQIHLAEQPTKTR